MGFIIGINSRHIGYTAWGQLEFIVNFSSNLIL